MVIHGGALKEKRYDYVRQDIRDGGGRGRRARCDRQGYP